MSNVECPYCGQIFSSSERQCPLCGAPNDQYAPDGVEASSSSKSNSSANTITCDCCGEVYDVGLTTCPLCGAPNNQAASIMAGGDDTQRRNSHERTYEESDAELIDEEGDFKPIKPKNKPYKKQQAPEGTLVLACFIGLIVIIICSFIGCASSIARNQTQSIGADLFQQQTTYTQQTGQ